MAILKRLKGSLAKGKSVAQTENVATVAKRIVLSPKFEPEAFTVLDRPGPCMVCGLNAVRFKSDYPSNVKPFSEQEVLYCTNCGSGQVPGSAELLQGYYEQDYASSNRKDREIEPEVYFSEEYRNSSRALQRYFGRAQRQISVLRQHGSQVTRMLDFGSGPGYGLFLSGAQEKFAFEPDEKSIKYLDHIKAKRFSAIGELRPSSFDAIIASHAIEHLVPEALIATLAILINSLTRDGVMLIEVPQGGHSYLHLNARQDPHTLFFTPQGLSLAVELAGGEILLQRTYGKHRVPLRKNPIYVPPDHPFYKEDRGALTVVCRRRRD
ncbi:class I SAM-dependent methyltransferase [Phycobacter sp. K97]|uniref:class I SAM-dependent methyltransferase n=1 Tax=Phycobacter sedimenti TaxID=3133977 RepID=UPI00311D4CCB